MSRGKHVVTTLTVALASTVLAGVGCSDPEPATPRVTLETELRIGSNTSQTCPQSGPLFTIGEFGTLGDETRPTKPVDDGQPFGQGSVSVSCAVTAAGNGGFDVRASTTLTGATGGLFKIEGTFRPEGQQTGITATLSKQPFGVFAGRDCTVEYDLSQGQGVAAGRVWGTLVCPKAERSDTGSVCESRATFRFENCAQ